MHTLPMMARGITPAARIIPAPISGVADDSVDFCNKLRESTGLYLSDGREYGECGRSFVRMNLATQRERVLDGLARLKRGSIEYANGNK